MRLAKVKSVVLDAALKSDRFPSLYMYIAGFGGFERTSDGCFVSRVVRDCDNKPVLDIRLALGDYFFNEAHEWSKLWDFAEKVIGKREVDLTVIKVVEL